MQVATTRIAQRFVYEFNSSLGRRPTFHPFVRRYTSNQEIMPVTIKDRIELTEPEQLLFTDLLETAKQCTPSTTLRAAGGWVRDKLMGHTSVDIDIALDDLLGKEFAEHVNDYLKSHHQETHRVAVIVSNPEQSKHLETARMKVRGLWIDLVNLRSEEYAKDSRIPSMTFGTPEQDASRRDFTINSLFYNINVGCIEDFTGKGLEDMRAGIIRTPLPAKETFLDDPLRVLRAVRFASRFAFECDADLLQAASDDQVREALGHKVSRERIGTELEGMLAGPDPVGAVKLLDKLGLFEAVFEVPLHIAPRAEGFPDAGTALLEHAHAVMKQWEPLKVLTLEEKRQLLIAALFLPLRELQTANGKNRLQTLSSHVIRDALKWKNKDVEAVELMHAVSSELCSIYFDLSSSKDVRVRLGNCIRKLKGMWRAGCVVASLLPLPEAVALGLEEVSEDKVRDGLQSHVLNQVEICKELEAAALAYKLDRCYTWKPLLDGKAVMDVLGMKQGGPVLGKLMDAEMEWQISHPDGTAQDCAQWLRQNFSDLPE